MALGMEVGLGPVHIVLDGDTTPLSKKRMYFTMGRPFSRKIAPTRGGPGPNLILDYLGPSKPTAQTVSRSIQPFLHKWLQSVPIVY